MATPRAEVLAVEAGQLRLRVDAPVACARCAEGRGCGAGLLGQGRASEISLPRPPGIDCRPGDRVRLALAPRRLLRAALVAYGLPLAALVTVPLLVNQIFGPLGDLVLALIALAGVAGAIIAGRRWLARQQCAADWLPEIDTERGA